VGRQRLNEAIEALSGLIRADGEFNG